MSASIAPVAKLYPIKLTKANATEAAYKIGNILEDFEATDGSFGTEEQMEALCQKLEAHCNTSCRQPIMLTAYEVETVADELDNSADAAYDNGDKAVANRMYTAANTMREAASLIH